MPAKGHYKHASLGDALLSRLDVMELSPQFAASQCWNFPSSINSGGYGSLSASGKSGVLAHRASVEVFNPEAFDEALDVDHLCRNRRCFNPSHLQMVPHRDNIILGSVGGFGRAFTHCSRGHKWEPGSHVVLESGQKVCNCAKRKK